MLERLVHKTGVEITEEQMRRIRDAMVPTIETNLDTGITVTNTPGSRGGLQELQFIALGAGLSKLLDGFNYCLDGNEIVCFEEAIV